MKTRNFTASIHKEGKFYVATCVEIGTVSQGHTLEEALKNLKEATELYLQEFSVKQPEPIFLTTFTTQVYAKLPKLSGKELIKILENSVLNRSGKKAVTLY